MFAFPSPLEPTVRLACNPDEIERPILDWRVDMSAGADRHGESELVARAILQSQRGDTEALHFLYVRYAPEVFSCVRGVVRGDRQAENVTQEIFRTLTACMEKYEQREAPFSDWLLRVARDVAHESASRDRQGAGRAAFGLHGRGHRVTGR
jgi:Sigma-70 region 2